MVAAWVTNGCVAVGVTGVFVGTGVLPGEPSPGEGSVGGGEVGVRVGTVWFRGRRVALCKRCWGKRAADRQTSVKSVRIKSRRDIVPLWQTRDNSSDTLP